MAKAIDVPGRGGGCASLRTRPGAGNPIFAAILLTGIVAGGCGIINPDEPKAAFLHLPHFVLETQYEYEGSNSHNIADAWIYVDNKLMGVFELPGTVPFLSGGAHELRIVPGIKKDGISANRSSYPFYEPFGSIYMFKPATLDTLIPSIRYAEDVSFALIEDFESGNAFGGMDVTSESAHVFEGARSGHIQLSESVASFSVQAGVVLPSSGEKIALEMDYLTESKFDVYVETDLLEESTYIVTISARPDDWNKIYVDLTTAVLTHPKAPVYYVTFKAIWPDSLSVTNYYWDNIKVLYK